MRRCRLVNLTFIFLLNHAILLREATLVVSDDAVGLSDGLD